MNTLTEEEPIIIPAVRFIPALRLAIWHAREGVETPIGGDLTTRAAGQTWKKESK